MNEKERLSALDVALNNEMREREFYLKNAERTKNPLGKAMFQRIGDDELEHYERLKRLHAEWEKQGKWPETVPLTVEGTVIKNTLLETVKKAGEKCDADTDDLAAVRTAIEFEAKGVAYYTRLRDSVSGQKEKEFFDLLSRIEDEHYMALKSAEEYFIDPASWFQTLEHHTIDGG